jgi:hypothetical protein
MPKKPGNKKPASAATAHPSPIYKHVPGGGLVKCVWNDAENEYDCEPIDFTQIPKGAGIFPAS